VACEALDIFRIAAEEREQGEHIDTTHESTNDVAEDRAAG
jgi:hypothetical protein